MKLYTKDGKIYATISSVILNNKQIINPKEEQILAAGYEIYIPAQLTDDELLKNAIRTKIAEVTAYADKDELNSYVALGNTIRLPLELRLQLRNVINSRIALGEENLTEYYEGCVYTYSLTAWDSQLDQYENYLYQVGLVAEQHKQNIKNLTSIEEVNSYDFTTGYPTQLVF